MSFNAELANTARWAKATAERLPENARPDMAFEWGLLMDELDACRSDGSRELALIGWRSEMGERLAVGLLHSPLDRTST